MQMRLKTKVLIGILAVTMGFVGIAAAEQAKGIFDIVNTYYSDATHSTIVGTVEYTCKGLRVQNGTQTNFASYAATDCSGGTPSEGNPPSDPVLQCYLIYTPYQEYVCPM